jgi:hypothetical protein
MEQKEQLYGTATCLVLESKAINTLHISYQLFPKKLRSLRALPILQAEAYHYTRAI